MGEILTVWLAGRTDYDEVTNEETGRWEVLGLYDDKDAAFARCKEKYDFVTPIKLNEDLPEETVHFECDWPRLT